MDTIESIQKNNKISSQINTTSKICLVMKLTLKDIRLPQDPLQTEQEHSGDESPHEQTRRDNKKRLDDMPDPDYDIPQNSKHCTTIAGLHFYDQSLEHVVKTFDNPDTDYSPTGNSWNQSDVDSAYHKYDPVRYDGRKPKVVENPQEDEFGNEAKILARSDTDELAALLDKHLGNEDIQQEKQHEDSSRLHLGRQSLSIPHSTRSSKQKSRRRSRSSQRPSSKRSQQSQRKGSRRKSKRHEMNEASNAVVPQAELDKLNAEAKASKDEHTIGREGTNEVRKGRRATLPDIQVSEVADGGQDTLQQMRKRFSQIAPHLQQSDRGPSATMPLPSVVAEHQKTLKEGDSLLGTSQNLKMQQTTRDQGQKSPTSQRSIEQKLEESLDSSDGRLEEHQSLPGQFDLSKQPGKDTRIRNRNNKAAKTHRQLQNSPFEVAGEKKELSQNRLRFQESTFSFRQHQQKRSQVSPSQSAKPLKEPPEGTPERIMRRFNQKADAYKLGLPFSSNPASTGNSTRRRNELRVLMNQCKELWQFENEDMYNTAPMVLYDAYLDNLSNTISSRLAKICNKDVRVNLRQQKAPKKIQITVTTVHQNKYRLTKFGSGFGYGVPDKMSPEDAILQQVIEKADSEVQTTHKAVGNAETLATLVPPIIKKPPKVITDSLKALHMTCRRGVLLDRNGMPVLVEKSPSSKLTRDHYMDYLHKQLGSSMQQYNSTASIHSSSCRAFGASSSLQQLPTTALQHNASRQLKQQKSTKQVMQEKKSCAKLTQRSTTSTRRQVMSYQQPSKAREKEWVKKVDDLINKFDESSRQSEIQQRQMREARDQLEAAKKDVLRNLDEQEERKQLARCAANNNSTDGESYKKDSCVGEEDEEEEELGAAEGQITQRASQINEEGSDAASSAERDRAEEQANMRRTFQTTAQREEYYRMCNTLFEKYSNMYNMANDAICKKRWDTREELLQMVKPKSMARINSLQASSKKSFKRDRNIDSMILNQRSSDALISQGSANRSLLSPQQLFEQIERIRLQREASEARIPPSLRSKAERELKQMRSRKALPRNQMSLLDLAVEARNAESQKRLLIGIGGQSEGDDNKSVLIHQRSSPAIKNPPTQRSASPTCELNADLKSFTGHQSSPALAESFQKSQKASMMTGPVASQTSPRGAFKSDIAVAQLPKKIEEDQKRHQQRATNSNKDIEVFISAKIRSPAKQSKASPPLGSKTGGSKKISKMLQLKDEAYQTLCAPLKQHEASTERLLRKMSRPQIRPADTQIASSAPDATNITGHQLHQNQITQTKTSKKNLKPDQRSSAHEGKVQSPQYEQNQKPRPAAKVLTMHIVEEADEAAAADRNQSKQKSKRPTPLQVSIKATKATEQQNAAEKRHLPPNIKIASKNLRSGADEDAEQVPIAQLAKSPSSQAKLSVKALKQHQKSAMKPSKRKPAVPSFSITPKSSKNQQSGGLTSPRGFASTIRLDLKPINHTEHAKFMPHPNNFERFRTKLPNTSKNRDFTEQAQLETQAKKAISPYQMMLEEMKKRELQNEEGVARPTIQDVNDSIEFRAGDSVGEDQADLRHSHVAFEEKLENLMRQTQSTMLGGAGQPRQKVRRKLLNSILSKDIESQTNTKIGGLGQLRGTDLKSDYFQDQELALTKQEKLYLQDSALSMRNTFSKILQKKFLDTELKFQQHAEKIVQDVRRYEQMAKKHQDDSIPRLTVQNSHSLTRNKNYAAENVASRTHIGFGRRHNQSVGLETITKSPFQYNRQLTLKDQLRQLKQKEANVGFQLASIDNTEMLDTVKSGFGHRRRTEFDKTGVKLFTKGDNDVGFDQHEIEFQQTYQSLRSTMRGSGPAIDISLIAPKGPPPISTSRGLFGPQGQDPMSSTQIARKYTPNTFYRR